MRDSKEAEYALIEWRNEINNYFNNESFLDDIQNAIMGDLNKFEAYFGRQLRYVNGAIHSDLLVNILMGELKATDQIREFILAELNDASNDNELFKLYSIASGFNDDEIASGSPDYSPEVYKCYNLMAKWSKGAKDSPKFRTLILERLIMRVFTPDIIEEDENFVQANRIADLIVNVGNRK